MQRNDDNRSSLLSRHDSHDSHNSTLHVFKWTSTTDTLDGLGGLKSLDRGHYPRLRYNVHEYIVQSSNITSFIEFTKLFKCLHSESERTVRARQSRPHGRGKEKMQIFCASILTTFFLKYSNVVLNFIMS